MLSARRRGSRVSSVKTSCLICGYDSTKTGFKHIIWKIKLNLAKLRFACMVPLQRGRDLTTTNQSITAKLCQFVQPVSLTSTLPVIKLGHCGRCELLHYGADDMIDALRRTITTDYNSHDNSVDGRCRTSPVTLIDSEISGETIRCSLI